MFNPDVLERTINMLEYEGKQSGAEGFRARSLARTLRREVDKVMEMRREWDALKFGPTDVANSIRASR